MEREVGGGIGMGNTCKPMAVSFQCMTKSTTNKKKSSYLLASPEMYPSGSWNQREKIVTKDTIRIIAEI